MNIHVPTSTSRESWNARCEVAYTIETLRELRFFYPDAKDVRGETFLTSAPTDFWAEDSGLEWALDCALYLHLHPPYISR